MLKINKRKSLRKKYTFTANFGGTIQMSPKSTEVPVEDITRNERNGLKSIRNTFSMDFGPGFWRTDNPEFVKIIRNSNLYGATIFELDENGKDITKEILDKLDGIEDAVIEPSKPVNVYKELPKSLIEKMSIKELQTACDTIGIKYKEEHTKKELIELITA